MKKQLRRLLTYAVFFAGTMSTTTFAQTDIHILDVGQGLSVLIESQGHYMLYDGGDSDKSSYVVSYLKQQGVSKLDYIIASHYDSDHLNGVVGALNVFPVENLFGPDYTADSRVFDSFQEIIAAKGLDKIQPAIGSEFSLGDATVQIIAPSGSDYSDANNYSIAIRLQDGDTSFLITGDAETKSEQEMLVSGFDLKSDVYVMSHHGSSSSNSIDFVQAISPKYAVLSCAAGNTHGHPHVEAMDAVRLIGAELLRTDRQGNLIGSTDGHIITWNVAPCNDYTPGEYIEAAVSLPPKIPSAEANSVNQNYASSAPAGISRSPYDGYETIVNVKTKKYHVPNCKSVLDMKEANKGYCSDADYLITNGYQPCKNCH